MGGKAMLRIKWVRSQIGYNRKQRATLRGLGFRRLQQVVEVEDTPSVRGMIGKVTHLVELLED
jgi:large subunit ribosomal protein L30